MRGLTDLWGLAVWISCALYFTKSTLYKNSNLGFRAEIKINVESPNNAKIIDFSTQYITDEFIDDILVQETNINMLRIFKILLKHQIWNLNPGFINGWTSQRMRSRSSSLSLLGWDSYNIKIFRTIGTKVLENSYSRIKYGVLKIHSAELCPKIDLLKYGDTCT